MLVLVNTHTLKEGYSKGKYTIALVENMNRGKNTLFSNITGSKKHVGN